MIVTVTPNPSIDRTVHLAGLRHGAVNRALSSTVEASGKGVNVARALAGNGIPALAVVPLGGAEGDQLAAMLGESSLPYVGVPIVAAIRSNVTLLEPGGVATKVNEPGPELSTSEADALLAAAVHASAENTWTVCCGSLPPSVTPDFYARVVTQVHAAGGRVAVDSSGEPLRLAAEAGADLVTPNVSELAEFVGTPLTTIGDVVAATARVRACGAGTVLASLGPDGALLAGSTTYHAETPHLTVVSTVGAGDALLAGFLAGGGDGLPALRTALAWAATCCQQPDSRVPVDFAGTAGDVTVHDGPDLDRRLVPHD